MFLLISGDCPDREGFAFIDQFYKHLKKYHSRSYRCGEPECTTSIKDYSEREIRNHLSGHSFFEFECLHCEEGFNDLISIKAHMSTNHSSQFLMIATRQTRAKMLYIGDDTNGETFTKYRCNNLNPLKEILPSKELMISDERYDLKLQELNQKTSKEIVAGPIEPIDFTKAERDRLFIRYHKYERLIGEKSSQSSHNPPQPSHSDQLIQPEEMAMDTDAMDYVSTINSPQMVPSTRTIEYGCISDEMVAQINAGNHELVPDFEQSHCFTADTEKNMITHRIKKHSHSPQQIAYWEIERNPEDHIQIQRLVQCTFHCNICHAVFDTTAVLLLHFSTKHKDCVIDTRIDQHVLVVFSNDAGTPTGHSFTSSHQYEYSQLFYCSKRGHDIVDGTLECALEHYEKHHKPKERFELQLFKTLPEKGTPQFHKMTKENQKPHRMYVFECSQCAKLFESIGRASAHCMQPTSLMDNVNRISHVNCNSFVAKKLIACSACKIVSTLDWIQNHECNKSANKIPVNAINPTRCAFCDCMSEKIDPLHYHNMHGNGYDLSMDMVKQLNLNVVEKEAFYSPGCCPTERYHYNQLDQLVCHSAKCCTSFVCNECEDGFEDLISLVIHLQMTHHRTPDEIIEWASQTWQCIKRVFYNKPLNEMRMFLPSGLTLLKNSNGFREQLKLHLTGLITENVWRSEMETIKRTIYGSMN